MPKRVHKQLDSARLIKAVDFLRSRKASLDGKTIDVIIDALKTGTAISVGDHTMRRVCELVGITIKRKGHGGGAGISAVLSKRTAILAQCLSTLAEATLGLYKQLGVSAPEHLYPPALRKLVEATLKVDLNSTEDDDDDEDDDARDDIL